MVDSVGISGKKGKLKGQLGLEQEKLKKAKLRGNPQEIRKIELRIKRLTKLGKKPEIGKAVKGSSKFAPEAKTPAEQASIFDPEKGAFADLWKKKKVKEEEDYPVEADDWWGEDEDPDWWKAKPKFGRSPGALGGRHDPWEGFKHGGQIKKAKKRKRAALRGYRAELRGG